MILRHGPKGPKTILRLGMLCLLLGLVAPWLVHPTSTFWQDALDGVRGLLLGAAIALNLWAAWLAGRARCGQG